MKQELQVVSQVKLGRSQNMVLAQPTPEQFVRSKPGRGGKKVRFVEGGYVVNQLNKVFGPLNWSFKITERGETKRTNEKNTEGEVWVYGELAIHDHKRGFEVKKGQYGQHPIHVNVPIGDALKAAGTDALKKCASLFGIALDVYWNQLDVSQQQPKEAPYQEPTVYYTKAVTKPAPGQSKAPKKLSIFERSKSFINDQTDPQILANAIQRIEDTNELTGAEKFQLKKLINGKLDQIKAHPPRSN